ncbi:MAG TPA: beta-eliminating lyase-related protein, partial [Terriglobales bacterium]|nr:beta-eliminating lyase-related protein [Terriglobales bacterium]
MKPQRSFASDNNAGIHPEILKAIASVNEGHVVGYGADPYTAEMVNIFRQHFGPDAEVFVAFNGTGANCLSLQALTRSYHAVICAASAHIYTDECGAPEKFTGCKLIPLTTEDGKLS